ncbi:hypothetical protein COL154_009082 [Colletotrichum chrysophilum]|nr:uncharacterized protein COL26b_011238 [Colletotrichum chrysophilum]KAJ0343520.1 hypothetical protein KNSL1_010197 [Colletotrichum chrysophilum]KAJ0358457.1 hypothetical protein COL154_009082 [Colletotrichum chrysophilum]KAJ0367398.1 hypothetical protein COL26b_011238 [Colletotrichum chrysophilum]
MASLIPVKESDISIVYNSNTRELVLAAKGEIPKVFLTPFFKQESVLNTGLTFSIRAFAGGFPPQKGEKSFEIKHSVHINLPLPHFNNKTVLIETASGNFSVEIKYTGFGPGPVVRGDNGSEEGTTYQDVLPPIKRFLPADQPLRITANIPKVEAPSRVNIEPSYNPEFLELIHSTVQEGSISWTFKWKKLPTEEGANPQLIDVTTHQYNGLVGPAARNYITIQGYVVLFVVFEKK